MNSANKVSRSLHIVVLAATVFSISTLGIFMMPNEAAAADIVVSGYKFNDLNQDGIWDSNEPALNDWEICATTSLPEYECVLTGDGVWADGYYEFHYEFSRQVMVEETLKDGWAQSFPANGFHDFWLSRATYPNKNFGNYILPFCGDNEVNQDTEECDGEAGIEGDQTCSDTCTLKDPVPMSITKAVDKNTAVHGDELAYAIEVTNSSGNLYCENATLILTDDITDVLVDAEASFAALSGSVATWTFENVACGETVSASFTATVLDSALDGAVIENTAWVRDAGDNESVTSNTVETLISAPVAPVLAISKTVNTKLANPSDTLTYTVIVSNTGDGDAYEVSLLDVLPAGITFADANGKNAGDTEKTWTWDMLAVGDDVTVTYDAIVDSMAGVDSYKNVATATASNFDHEVSDDAIIEVRIPVVLDDEAPLLSIEKTVSVDFANPGETVTYTVVVTNIGDAPALNVTLTDVLPKGLVFTKDGTTTRTWKLDDIVPTENVTITYAVIIDASTISGKYVNVAVATADDTPRVDDNATVEVREIQVLGEEAPPTVLPVTGAGILGIVVGSILALGSVLVLRRRTR